MFADVVFASLRRYRWLRELRALWLWAAGLLLVALVGQFALTSPHTSVDLEAVGPLRVLPGQAITLTRLETGKALVNYSTGRGSGLDLRFDRAQLAQETRDLLHRVGITLPDGDAPASWMTRAEPAVGDEIMSRFQAAAVEAGNPPGALLLRVLAGATARQVRLEMSAQGAPLEFTLSLPWTGDAHSPRKVLRLGETELVLPGTLPIKLRVPPGAIARAIINLPDRPPPLLVTDLEFGSFSGREGGGLAVSTLGLDAIAGSAPLLACGAMSGRLLWRAAGRLIAGDCPVKAGTIRVRSLEMRSDGAVLQASGNAWVLRDGQALGDDLLTRLRRQPVWWALLLVVDGLLVAWCVLAILPGPRRIALRGVFVSYRRADSGPRVGRLHDQLVARLGAERVFLDVESIPAGEDFDRYIADSLSRVDIVLAVIGPQWLDSRDRDGLRRLDADDDLVRREIAAALNAGLRVIPVLVGGATMPTADQLPAAIAELAGRNAAEIGERQFLRDADDLIDQLELAAGPSAGNAAGN